MTEETKSGKQSRIGKKPIALPAKVTVSVSNGNVVVKGPRGEMSQALVATTDINVEEKQVSVVTLEAATKGRAYKQGLANHGLMRALLANMITGVSTGFTKELVIIGTGYKADVMGKKLVLNLGYSHTIDYPIPEGIVMTSKVEKAGVVVAITGNSKETVGQIASEIRGYRPPDSYKGKGVRYRGEVVRLKSGKK
jgi:large subunit ribosomal protein L6